MRITTQQRIIEAALTVFSKNPLATLEQVAIAAGIGRATLFRHFSGKKSLMRELSLESYRRCMLVLSPLVYGTEPPLKRLKQAVEALIPLGAAFHFLSYEPWRTADTALEHGRITYLNTWGVLLSQLQDAGEIDAALPLYWLITSLDSLLYGAWEAVNSGEIAPRQAANLTLGTFLRGVTSDSSD